VATHRPRGGGTPLARRCIGLGCAGIAVDDGCKVCRADGDDRVEDQAPRKVSENFLQQTPASAVMMDAWKDARALADTRAADESELTLAAREGDRSPHLVARTPGVVRARASELCIAFGGWKSRDGKRLRQSNRPKLGPGRTSTVLPDTALDTEACSNPHAVVLRGGCPPAGQGVRRVRSVEGDGHHAQALALIPTVSRKRGRDKWVR
jgi:hypothetical protein